MSTIEYRNNTIVWNQSKIGKMRLFDNFLTLWEEMMIKLGNPHSTHTCSNR